jgi:hypothetical protein
MKNNIAITNFIAIITMAFTFNSCKAQAPNNTQVDETVVTFLVDCTDKVVFEDAWNDFHDNLAVLFNNLGIGKLNSNEKLTVRIGAIDDSDRLSLKSASIAAASKKASKREQEARSNPRPLLQLISNELESQKKLCERDMKCSPIIDAILKSCREMQPESSREVLVVCSDLVEYSSYANFYKSIPSSDKAVAKVVDKMDSILLNEARDRIQAVDPQVIFVLKSNPKVKTADLKAFYTKLMNDLGIKTVSFIDNMSLTPNI